VPALTRRVRALAPAALAAALVAAASGWLVDRFGPAPVADVALGSEEAFAVRTDLHARELPPQAAPLRWTGHRVRFQFRHLPSGSLRLEVQLRDFRAPVTVTAGGAVVGRMEVGETRLVRRLPGRAEDGLDVELRTRSFVAEDGRTLGMLLGRVALEPEERGGVSLPLVGLFVAGSVSVFAAAAVSGLGALGSLLTSALASFVVAALLWPFGVARSPFAAALTLVLVLGVGAAAGFAAAWRRQGRPLQAAAFVAALAALLVQGLAVTSPLFVVSDALFHANKLAAVAQGDLLPTSVTQHEPPFRIPYGVSFYAVLAPLLRSSADAVPLVRWGAAIAGIVGSLAVFALASPLGARVAALAVVLLQLMPGVVDIHSYGNLSNVFGQALTAAFVAWWAGRARGGGLAGFALLATAGLGHLSSLIVLFALAPALAIGRYPAIREDRSRLAALTFGGLALVLYYVQFWPLVRDQLPRLIGAGTGSAGPDHVGWSRALQQLRGAFEQWGAPALVLAVIGRPRPRATSLERDLTAFWWAGAALALVAVFSPLEVRYLYALTVPLAVAAASGADRLVSRGRFGAGLAAALVGAQVWLAVAGLHDALVHRYRP
jgi:hypothetical protein